MKFILFFYLLLLSLFTQAQTQYPSLQKPGSVLLSEVIKDVEVKTDYKFYFIEKWLDSVYVKRPESLEPVTEVLKEILKNTGIYFYQIENKIILTKNVKINAVIEDEFFNRDSSYSDTTKQTPFLKEYIPEIHEASTSRKSLIEIGTKQEGIPKSNSSVVGYIKERKSGEGISGATIFVAKLNKGSTSDPFGFYSISLPPGLHTLSVQYAGMKPIKQNILIHSDGKLDLFLEEDMISLKEVIIEAEKDLNTSGVLMGVNKFDIKSMKNVPKILGENDILKVALTIPGIKTIGEGSAGLNVRGGNADQNLILLNEATIYNTSHFLGFFSIFNADVIKTSEVYKSGIPAQYGGRVSSVFDIQLKDGNKKKFSGEGGIGPVTTRLALEIPLIKNKTSMMLGGRTTYSDWILKRIPANTLKRSRASFYDLIFRVSHEINEKNSLYLSLYHSKDKYKLTFDSLFSYHNAIGSLQWRHSFNKSLNSVVSLTHSEYEYEINYRRIPQDAFNLGFKINESNFKSDFNYRMDRHHFNFGFQSKYYSLNPGFREKASSESLANPKQIEEEQGIENAIYLSDNFEITDALLISAGIRYSTFTALGPRTIYRYREGAIRDPSTVIDTANVAGNQLINTFHGPEFRLSARYNLPLELSVKASYNRTRQYIHMLSNTVSVSPTNTWKLSDPNILPQIGDQLSIGYYKNFRSGTVETSIEAYYKSMQNIIDYKIGAQLFLNDNLERAVLQGEGKAYGVEFLIRKKSGKLNGWIGYTYSRTFLKLASEFPQERVNGGEFFPANYDKPHDLNVVSNYKISRRYSFSINFTYNTGRPITYPIGQYRLGGGYKIQYSDRNEYRIPDYIRLDVGVNIEGSHKIKKLAHSFWTISVYNVLGRKNPYSLYFVSENGVIKGYKLSVFGAPIPTITYNFKF